METDYKKMLESYLRVRLEEITCPANFAYGFMTYHGAEERLMELHSLALKMQLYEMSEKIGAAIKPIRAKIEEARRRGNFFI